MTKKISFLSNPFVLIAVLLVALAIGYSFLSGSESAPAEADGAEGILSFAETEWEIGDVSMADGDHIKEIAVENLSEAPVTITSMSTSCMCTSVQLVHENGEKSRVKGMPGHGEPSRMSEVIEPGERAILKVIYDPNAHGPNATGPIRRTITIKTDSQAQSEVKLSFSGNVVK